MPLSRNEPANFDGEMYRVHAGISAQRFDRFRRGGGRTGRTDAARHRGPGRGTLTWCMAR